MSIPMSSLIRVVHDAAGLAMQGPRAPMARSVMAALQGAPRSGTDADLHLLRSVIGGKARVMAVSGLTDQAAVEAWLASAESPAALRLQADAVAAALFQGPVAQGWFATALAATCAVLVTRKGVTRLVGSGVAVQADPAVILTNRHVVAGLVSGDAGDGLVPVDGVVLEVSFGNAAGGPVRFPVVTADLSAGPDTALLHLAAGQVASALALPAAAAGEVPPGVAVTIGFPSKAITKDEIRLFRSSGLLGQKVLSVGIAGVEGEAGTFPGFDPAVAWHDCATCQGFSGSPMLSVAAGGLFGLHFHGGAVASGEQVGYVNLAVDLRRVDLGLQQAPQPAVPVVMAARPAPPVPIADWQGVSRALSIQRDLPDPRDLAYQADLSDLPASFLPPPGLTVLDQGAAPTCVGHALAAAINMALARRKSPRRRVSARMLYECARAHDDVADDLAPGSTLRGAIKGFFHNGVAPEEAEDQESGAGWSLTRPRSRAAREVQLGTYRRVPRDFDALHAAIRDTGAVVVSARLHPGWLAPVKGRIRRVPGNLGGHAFVVVGFDRTGLIVLNSWGPTWGGWRGSPGLALWTYADAAETLYDAWVLRLAVPAPAIARIVQKERAAQVVGTLRRADVIGHMMALSDGGLHSAGKFGFDAATHAETAGYLGQVAKAPRPKYRDLLLVCHDLTRDRAEVAARTAKLRAAMKPLRIWPMSLMLDSAFGRCLAPMIAQAVATTADATEGTLRSLRLTEEVGPAMRGLWAHLPSEVTAALGTDSSGGRALEQILQAAVPLRLHLMAEGTGALLAGFLLAGAQADRNVEGLYLLDPILPASDFSALFLPSLTRAKPVRRFVQGFGRPETDFAGSGQSMVGLMAEMLSRPFHAFKGTPSSGLHLEPLPAGVDPSHALGQDLALRALAAQIRRL